MIREQLVQLGAAVLYGWIIGFIYCMLSRMDPIFNIRNWIRGIRDILFGCAAGFFLFLFVLYMANGILRGYVILGVTAGWLLAFGCNKLPEILKKRLTHRKE